MKKTYLVIAMVLAVGTLQAYINEATDRLQAIVDALCVQQADGSQTAFIGDSTILKEIKQLIRAGADPRCACGQSQGGYSLMRLLLIAPSWGGKVIDFPLWEEVIKLALHNGAQLPWGTLSGDLGSIVFADNAPRVMKMVMRYQTDQQQKDRVREAMMNLLNERLFPIVRKKLEEKNQDENWQKRLNLYTQLAEAVEGTAQANWLR